MLLISVHRYTPQSGYGFYPGTGASDDIGRGAGAAAEPPPHDGGPCRRGHTVNVPLPYLGMGDVEYAAVMEALVLPLLQEWAPDLTLVSCGLDAAHGDPLGGMHVTPHCFRHMAALLTAGAPPCGIVFALEGGYNLDSLAQCVDGILTGMLDAAPPPAGGREDAAAAVVAPIAALIDEPAARHAPLSPAVPCAHPGVLQCLRNVAAAQAPHFACMRELDTRYTSPQRAVGGSSDATARFVPPVDHAFDHQRVRQRRSFVRHVAPCGGGRGGWVVVSYARPRFPHTKFVYTDSAYDEPVHDTHLYLLLAPSAHLLAAAPPAGPLASSAHTGRQQPSDDDEVSALQRALQRVALSD